MLFGSGWPSRLLVDVDEDMRAKVFCSRSHVRSYLRSFDVRQVQSVSYFTFHLFRC